MAKDKIWVCQSHTLASPFTLKRGYLEPKEELWKFKYFTIQKFNLQKKKPSKTNQNPSRYYYNSIITNLSSFNNTSQKIIIFQKSSYENRPTFT
jgi:hypothetical protein